MRSENRICFARICSSAKARVTPLLSTCQSLNTEVENLPQCICTIFTLDIASIPCTLSLAIIRRQRTYRSAGSEKQKKNRACGQNKINKFIFELVGSKKATRFLAFVVDLRVSVIIKELCENLPLNEGYKIAGTFTNPGLNVSKVWLNSCGDLLVSLLVLRRCLKVQSITPTVKPWWRNSYSPLTGSYRRIPRSGLDAWGVDSGPYVSVDGIRGEGRDLYWTLGPIRRQSLWLIKGLKRADWWVWYWLPGENEQT